MIVTVAIGNFLYYFLGIFKKIGSASIDEVNESEMFVTEEGELTEEFPDEEMTENEVQVFNIFGKIVFMLFGSLIWIFMGITLGRIAYLFQVPALYRFLFYLFIFFFLLRIPFGVVNKVIEKSYDVKLIPEKLIIGLSMIASYVIGINVYDVIPGFLTYHLAIFD